jgi:hypothetical protein
VGVEFAAHGFRESYLMGLAKPVDVLCGFHRHVCAGQPRAAIKRAVLASLGAFPSDPNGGLQSRVSVAAVFTAARLTIAVLFSAAAWVDAEVATGFHASFKSASFMNSASNGPITL